MISQLDRRTLVWLCAAAFALRALVAALTPVPAEDAANYLWMAEQFAAGRVAAALDEVFPPLLPLLCAPLVGLGLDPFRVGQSVCVASGTLAVVAIAGATSAVVPGGALAAAVLTATASLPVRYAGLVYTEPVFHLFGALAVWAGCRQRFVWCGACAGAAFWLRPEAALIVVAFALGSPRRALRALAPLGAAIVGLAAWRASLGHPFELVPKLSFTIERLAAEPDLGGGDVVTRFLANVAQVPWLWLEAFGVVGALALVGIVAARRREQRPLLVMLALGIVLVCVFVPRRRFLVSWLFVAVPLAAAGLLRLPERVRRPAWIVAAVLGTGLALRVPESDRHAERLVGRYLRGQLAPGQVVTGDMTRVVWFAGCRPLPPRRFAADEIVAMARDSGVRYCVLGANRESTPTVVASLTEFAAMQLPYEIERRAAGRGILVLERKE